MGKDYYAILGVPKDANDDQLKRAYRKLAMKWHPDKNQENRDAATAKFQEISEAYDVLKDPEKRRIYDQVGEEGLKGGGAPGTSAGFSGMPGGTSFTFTSTDADNLFREFFGGGDINDIFRMFGHDDSSDGGMPGFSGMGGMPGFGMFGSPMGGGTTFMGVGGGMPGAGARMGRKMGKPKSMPQDPPIENTLNVSLEDLYTGATKRMKVTKSLMDASGARTSVERVLEIPISKGWKSGTKITFEKEGDEYPDRIPADIIFTVKEKPHELFRRDGDDLIHVHNITLEQALSKTFDVELRLLDGKMRRIRCENQDINRDLVINDLGMPKSKSPGKFGRMIITFKVLFPTNLSDPRRDQILELLRGSRYE